MQGASRHPLEKTFGHRGNAANPCMNACRACAGYRVLMNFMKKHSMNYLAPAHSGVVQRGMGQGPVQAHVHMCDWKVLVQPTTPVGRMWIAVK